MEQNQAEALLQIKQEPLEIMDTEEEANYNGNADSNADIDYGTEIMVKQEPTDVLEMSVNEVSTVEESTAQDAMQSNAPLPPTVHIKEEPDDYIQNPVDILEIVDEHKNMITVNAAEYYESAGEPMQPAYPEEQLSRRGRPRKTTCPICMRRFQSAKLFTDHKTLHSLNLIFCTYKNCNEAFATIEDCELHEYNYHKCRQLKCNVCNHKFLTFDALLDHKKKMHGKLKRHVCSVCREWFIDDEELYEHWVALPQTCGVLLQMNTSASDKHDKGVYALKPAKIPIQKLRIKKHVELCDINKRPKVTINEPKTCAVDQHNFKSVQSPQRTCYEDQQLLESLRSKKRAPQFNSATSLTQQTNIDMYDVQVSQSAQTANAPIKFKPITEQTPVVFIKEKSFDDDDSTTRSAQSTPTLLITEETPVVCIKEEPVDDIRVCQAYEFAATNKHASVTAIATEMSFKYGGAGQEQTTNHSTVMPITAETPVIFIKQEPADDFPNDEQFLTTAQNIPIVHIKDEDISITTEGYNHNKPPMQSKVNICTLPIAASADKPTVASNNPVLIPIEPLSSVLARRITSNFSLKTVPKMFNFTTQANAGIEQRTPATALEKPLSAAAAQPSKIFNPNVTTVSVLPPALAPKVATPKMLKLSPHMKIVKFSPEAKPQLTNVVASAGGALLPTKSQSNGNATTAADDSSSVNNTGGKLNGGNADDQSGLKIEFTTVKGQKLFGDRHFTLKKIELPNADAVKMMSPAEKEEVITAAAAVAADAEKSNKYAAPNAHRIPGNEEVYSRFDIEQELEDSREVYGYETTQSMITDLAMQTANRGKSKTASQRQMLETLICNKCNRQCSSRSMMKDHIKSDCGRHPHHECAVCHKRFFSASTLRCHRTIHTGELPHKCNFCEKRFRTRGQVTVHHRTHTGERPFVCEVCMQGFTHRETLISHLSRHIGMKRYKCYGCDKQFSCISGLSMHRANRQSTCAQVKLNTRAIGPRVRVIKGQVMFEAQPEINSYVRNEDPEVLTEIQNK